MRYTQKGRNGVTGFLPKSLISTAMVLILVTISCVGLAQGKRTPVQSEKRSFGTKRLELTGLGGWQFGGSVDFEGGSASFDAGAAVGGLVGVQVRKDARAVVSYHYQFSEANVEQPNRYPESQRLGIGVGYLQFGGEIDFGGGARISPIVGLTLGASHFSPESEGSSTDWFFAGMLYGAVKIALTKRFGLRGQFNFMMTVINNDSESLCISGQGCAVALDVGVMVQGEIAGGVYLAF